MVKVFGFPVRVLVKQGIRPRHRTGRNDPLILETGEQTNWGGTGGREDRGRAATGHRWKQKRRRAGTDENHHRLRPDQGNRRIRAMNLPVA